MRIAYLGSKGLPSKSGTERVIEGIVSRLSTKHAITVYCDSRYTPKGTTVDGVRLIRVPTIKGKHIQPVSLFFLSALHALFSRYDLIHLHGTDACFTLPILRMRYRVVSTVHGTPGRIMRAKWGRVARFFIRMMELPLIYLSNCRTSVSRLDAEFLEARYRREVIYIPNGVDEDPRVDLSLADRRLIEAGLQPGHYLLFAAGRIDPSKGCHLVLEALNRLEKPLKLGIVGDLKQVPSYSSHLRQVADPKRVTFFNPIADQALLFGMVKQSCLFVFPSISEGMSMMLLEAASLKVPMVCSDIPENKSIMQDNVLYFQSGDAIDLADKMSWALDHPDEMARLALRAHRHVIRAFSWQQIAGQYEEIYKACAKAG